VSDQEKRVDSDNAAIRRFHELYYGGGVYTRTTWLGVQTYKCPLDLWTYQEILVGSRPDLIIETGTLVGGSAFFLASICDLLGQGRIVTVDLRVREGLPEHPRITYLHGDSASPAIVSAVTEMVRPDERVMVILDSAHERDHVLNELHAYAPLVSEGQYLIVEDTNINGNPVFAGFGPGPKEAVEAFLLEELGSRFAIDRDREKFLMTFNPGGYLIRREGGQPGDAR
jgi:cephalosporin hydroxylase